ncbi:unnamed protein product [Cylicostephanus goldi]|uniref:Uncharacterized protein n=1 Tax=Cylicostephanus goldi TaxID=71465 RepID=A0A3P6PY09_CYLGO|nr:unnamed protein product [Cylicostephanus goldi]
MIDLGHFQASLIFFAQALWRQNRPPPIRIPPPGNYGHDRPPGNPWQVDRNPFVGPPYHFPRPPPTTRRWWGRGR